jgi:hypothetical protein
MMQGRRWFLKSAAQTAAATLCMARRARAATVIRQPYLKNMTANSATVLWTTEENGRGAIRFSRDL